MKIGFPASGSSEDDRLFLSTDFIESGMIGVYDTDTEVIDVVSKDEMELNIMDWVEKNSIEAIITPELKVMALKVFRERGIDVYKAEGSMLMLNVELMLNNCLTSYSVMEMFEQGASSCSSSSCSSCSSGSCN